MILQATISIPRKCGDEIQPTKLSFCQTEDKEKIVISGDNIIYDYVLDRDAVMELFDALGAVLPKKSE